MEERESEPPEEEMDNGVRADREIARLQGRIALRGSEPPTKPKKR